MATWGSTLIVYNIKSMFGKHICIVPLLSDILCENGSLNHITQAASSLGAGIHKDGQEGEMHVLCNFLMHTKNDNSCSVTLFNANQHIPSDEPRGPRLIFPRRGLIS